MVTASQWVVVLMPPEDKARLEAKARRAGTSMGEIVRRSVDAYEPELQGAELEALVRLLEESHGRAMKSLDEAEMELATTRAYFDARQKQVAYEHRRQDLTASERRFSSTSACPALGNN